MGVLRGDLLKRVLRLAVYFCDSNLPSLSCQDGGFLLKGSRQILNHSSSSLWHIL